MIIEFGKKPPDYTIDRRGNMAHVTLFANREQFPPYQDDAERWRADVREFDVPLSDGIENDIKALVNSI